MTPQLLADHNPPQSLDPRPLAVFDLDGTLLTHDSFLPFLVRYTLRRRRFWPLAVLPPYVLLYLARLWSDRRAKERLLTAFFGGQPLERIADHAEAFNEVWVKRRLRSPLIERLRRHQEAGDRVILLSASPDLYVNAIARMLGIAEVVATRVGRDGDLCTGRIVGDNCKGKHKVEMLRRHLGRDSAPAGSAAYGDSKSDLPILRWVERGYLVRGGALEEVTNGKANQPEA